MNQSQIRPEVMGPIFDRAIAGVLANPFPAYSNKSGSCMYRLEKGGQAARCAVGHAFPDLPLQEGAGVWGQDVPGITLDEHMLLRELQFTHDNPMERVGRHGLTLEEAKLEFADRAARLAAKYDVPLTVTIPA